MYSLNAVVRLKIYNPKGPIMSHICRQSTKQEINNLNKLGKTLFWRGLIY